MTNSTFFKITPISCYSTSQQFPPMLSCSLITGTESSNFQFTHQTVTSISPNSLYAISTISSTQPHVIRLIRSISINLPFSKSLTSFCFSLLNKSIELLYCSCILFISSSFLAIILSKLSTCCPLSPCV